MLGSVLLFLNIGSSELILIMFVALMLFGGEKLPGLARTLGKGIRDFKDASEGVKREINNQIYNYEEKEKKPAIDLTKKEEEQPAAEETTHTDQGQVAEHKPLIDTTPVHGTMPLGYQAPTEEPHATETDIDKLAEETHQDKLSK